MCLVQQLILKHTDDNVENSLQICLFYTNVWPDLIFDLCPAIYQDIFYDTGLYEYVIMNFNYIGS